MLAAALRLLRLIFQTDGGYNITLAGTAVLILAMVYSSVRLARRNAQAGPVSVLLALMGATSLAGGSLLTVRAEVIDSRNLILILVMGVGSFIVGLAMLLRERKFVEFKPSRSFGLLYSGMGVYILVSATLLPTIPVQWNATPTAFITSSATATRTIVPTRTLASTLTITPSPTHTSTKVPLPTLTLTPTREPLLLPTRVMEQTAQAVENGTLPGAIATTSIVHCTIIVVQNVNFRTAPSTNAIRLDTIPYNTVLPVSGITVDRTWWNVVYRQQSGWVNGEFVQPEGDCEAIPILQP